VIGVIALYVLFSSFSFRSVRPERRGSFLVFHSLQYWNAACSVVQAMDPLMCSGLSLAGEPQVPSWSLSMALSYVWGSLVGSSTDPATILVAGWIWRGFSTRAMA